jgi:hypothetical protein
MARELRDRAWYYDTGPTQLVCTRSRQGGPGPYN